MVVEKYLETTNGVADAITTAVYGEETMAEAMEPSDDERLKKIAFVRDGVRLFITVLVTIVILGVVYFVAKKVGVIAWIKSKLN